MQTNAKSGVSFKYGDLIYENPLSSEADVSGFVMEGDAKVSFPNGRMRLENNLDPSLGQASNYVFWCNKKLPDSVAIEWEFTPISEPGLAIMFFSADGQNGKDLFDTSLAKRTGEYKQYHSSDINAFHVSYFRHSTPDESGFRVCNLRKSAGFYMVAQGADPLPPAEAVQKPYKLTIIKDKEIVRFFISDPVTGIELMPFEFVDNGTSYGDILGGGYIGFRQKAPLVAEYSNLKVYSVERVK
ncbi:MAG: YesU family protein [Clostridia bacterium]|nr:YesU family protein [Clostridia bacterium]